MRITHAISFAVVMAVCCPAKEFTLPSVPENLQSPPERAHYVAMHFWDNADWTDSCFIADENGLEHWAATYFSVLPLLDSTSVNAAAKQLAYGMHQNREAINKFALLARDYLLEPESPTVDDEVFLAVTDCLTTQPTLSEANRLRLGSSKRDALLNRLGSQTADFTFKLRSGAETTLLKEIAEHNVNIVVFYDPDCEICHELETWMSNEVGNGIGVVMICPFADSTSAWEVSKNKFKFGWTVGIAPQGFEDSGLYDLRYIPSVMVLDKNGSVLAKNLTLETLRDTLLRL